jgi:4-amino-4-deoxy-L-arabinose transferase-like glycosyltransferase
MKPVLRNRTQQLFTLVRGRETTIVALLCGLIVLAGTVYSLQLGNTLRFGDENAYYSLAKNLVTTGSFTLTPPDPTAVRPPGYPWLLAPLVHSGIHITGLRILNFVALAATVYLIYVFVGRLSSKVAGLVAAFMVCCYPVLFYTAGTLYPQTIGTLLFLLILFVLHRAEGSTNLGDYVAAGLLFGYLVLMIPSFIFCLPLVAMWMLYQDRRRHLNRMLVMTLAAALVITPWTIRNYMVFGSFVLVSTNSGVMLLAGNSPNTTPNSGITTDISEHLKYVQEKGFSEVEVNRYFTSKAMEFVKQNPVEAIKLYLLKVLNHFNYTNTLATSAEASPTKDLIMLLTYGTLLLIVLGRLSLFKRFPLSRVEMFFLTIYVANAFFLALFFTRIRYRLPFDLLLIALAAVYITYFLNRFSDRLSNRGPQESSQMMLQ